MQQDIKDVIYPISATGVILDGQHRIKACEKLGKSIKFQIVDNAGADYIHDINTVGSVWQKMKVFDYYQDGVVSLIYIGMRKCLLDPYTFRRT